jgi:hypothetical protein
MEERGWSVAEVNAACTSSTEEQGELGEGRRCGGGQSPSEGSKECGRLIDWNCDASWRLSQHPILPYCSLSPPSKGLGGGTTPRTLCPALRCQFAPLQQLPEVQPPAQVSPALLNGALLLPLTGCCCEMVERPSLLLGVVDFLTLRHRSLNELEASIHSPRKCQSGRGSSRVTHVCPCNVEP